MMHTIGTIREFKTRNFMVIVDAVEDGDLDLSFDEDGDTLRGLESGRYVSFCARVRVFFKGNEVGSDYLGGCIYKSIDAFQDHRAVGLENELRRQDDQSGRCGSYFHDMIRSACAEARKTIADLKDVRIRA